MKRSVRRVLSMTAASFVGLVLSLAGAFPAAAQQPPQEVPRFLTLQDAVRIALEGSTRLGIDQARLDSSEKARLNAIFSLGPGLTVTAFNQRATRTDFDAPQFGSELVDFITTDSGTRRIPVDSTFSTGVADVDEISGFKQVQVSGSVRLFDGFANWYRVGAAYDEVASNRLNREYTATNVQTSVIQAYYNLLRAQLLLKVSEESVDVSREQLERTQALYELGSAARSDVLKSQVQLGQTRLELVQARNRERQSRDGLVYSMNLRSATPFAIDTTVADPRAQSFDFDTEVQHALTNRLDLMAMRETEAAEGKRVVAARGPLFPTVDFQYSVSYSDQESEFRFGAQKTRNRSWALSSTWNVFDRYQTYANIGQAKANKRIAEYNRKQAELDAIREIRDFVNDIQEARERLQVARENVARSEEDLRLAAEKFRVGAGTILDTITAESDLTATKAAAVEAVVDYLIARAQLSRATGRPFADL
jgi:outer membrane protein TolC